MLSRASRFRASVGRRSRACARASPSSKRSASRATRTPFSPLARSHSVSSGAAPASSAATARTAVTRSAGPSLRGGASAFARCAAAALITRTGPIRCRRSASAVTAAPPPGPSSPSASQTISAGPVTAAVSSAAAAAARSTGHGLGASPWIRSRASPARINPLGAMGRPLAGGAVLSTRTGRLCRSASSRRPVIWARLSDQSCAAPQPSSTTIKSGPGPRRSIPRFTTGSATARTISAAMASLSAISHHGVLAGVSSVVPRSRRRRMAGKMTRLGAGGVKRSSHHTSGNSPSAANIHGLAKGLITTT